MTYPDNPFLLHGEDSDRLTFRSVDRRDFAAWLKFFEDPSCFQHWIVEKEIPETACDKWYEKQFHRYTNNLGGMNALIEKKTNQLVGHAGLLVQSVDGISELEIAYSLLPAFWNKGFASEAAQKIKSFAFDRSLSTSLISIISLTNTPSAKVAVRTGMSIDKVTTYHLNDVNIFRIFSPTEHA